jgi:hypothetical protein
MSRRDHTSVILCFGSPGANCLKERVNLTGQNPAQRQLRQSVRGKEGGLRRLGCLSRNPADNLALEEHLLDVEGKGRVVALFFPVEHRKQAQRFGLVARLFPDLPNHRL